MSQIISDNEVYADVVELCALLQCLGFSVKSLETSDGNISQEGGMRSVVINCQSSGLHVVLESPSLSCSCPAASNQQNSGIWQVSGISGGEQLDKEFGCSSLGSIPKSHRERLSKELHEMIKCIKQQNESDADIIKEPIENKSASMVELKTPEKRDFPVKNETPTLYRSLDTLTSQKRQCEQALPDPGPLQKVDIADASDDESRKEFGCSSLGSIPKSHRERLSKELHEMIKCIKQQNESDADIIKEPIENKSASMVELKTPEKRDFPVKNETPTLYRSLDTLTSQKRQCEQALPDPGPLQKVDIADASDDESRKEFGCSSLGSIPKSHRERLSKELHEMIKCIKQQNESDADIIKEPIENKSASMVELKTPEKRPIHASQSTLLDSLIVAVKAADELHTKLTDIIRDFMEEGKHDSSISSLILDASKISLLKCPEASKAQFASSPNLSGMGFVKEDVAKSRLKRFESASTSNLALKSGTAKEKFTSRLRRLSPNIFKGKKESPSVAKAQDERSKLNSLLTPKIAVTPVRTPRSNMEASPGLSSSKKKWSHIKSTIPRPSKKE